MPLLPQASTADARRLTSTEDKATSRNDTQSLQTSGIAAVASKSPYDQVPGQGTRRECRAATCARCRLLVHLSNGGEQIALIGLRRLGSEGRNLYVVARLRIIHGSRYCRGMRLYLWPSTRRKNNDGDGSRLQVLLVGRLRSAVTKTSKPSRSAASNSSPFLSDDHPNSADRIT